VNISNLNGNNFIIMIEVSTTQGINGFSLTNTHRLKQFSGYFHSMGRIIIRDP
jgi:hypothetical protein